MDLVIKWLLISFTFLALQRAECKHIPSPKDDSSSGDDLSFTRFQEANVINSKIKSLLENANKAIDDLNATSKNIRRLRTIPAVEKEFNAGVDKAVDSVDSGLVQIKQSLNEFGVRLISYFKSCASMVNLLADEERPSFQNIMKEEDDGSEPMILLTLDPKKAIAESLKKNFDPNAYPTNLYGKKTSSYKKLFLIEKTLREELGKIEAEVKDELKHFISGMLATKNIQTEVKSTGTYPESIEDDEEAIRIALFSAKKLKNSMPKVNKNSKEKKIKEIKKKPEDKPMEKKIPQQDSELKEDKKSEQQAESKQDKEPKEKIETEAEKKLEPKPEPKQEDNPKDKVEDKPESKDEKSDSSSKSNTPSVEPENEVKSETKPSKDSDSEVPKAKEEVPPPENSPADNSDQKTDKQSEANAEESKLPEKKENGETTDSTEANLNKEKDSSTPSVDTKPEPQDSAQNSAVPEPQDSAQNSAVPEPQDSAQNSAVPKPQDSAQNSAVPEPQDSTQNSAVPEPQDSAQNSAIPEPTATPENKEIPNDQASVIPPTSINETEKSNEVDAKKQSTDIADSEVKESKPSDANENVGKSEDTPNISVNNETKDNSVAPGNEEKDTPSNNAEAPKEVQGTDDKGMIPSETPKSSNTDANASEPSKASENDNEKNNGSQEPPVLSENKTEGLNDEDASKHQDNAEKESENQSSALKREVPVDENALVEPKQLPPTSFESESKPSEVKEDKPVETAVSPNSQTEVVSNQPTEQKEGGSEPSLTKSVPVETKPEENKQEDTANSSIKDEKMTATSEKSPVAATPEPPQSETPKENNNQNTPVNGDDNAEKNSLANSKKEDDETMDQSADDMSSADSSPKEESAPKKKQRIRKIKVVIFTRGGKKYRAEAPIDANGNEMKHLRRVRLLRDDEKPSKSKESLSTRDLEPSESTDGSSINARSIVYYKKSKQVGLRTPIDLLNYKNQRTGPGREGSSLRNEMGAERPNYSVVPRESKLDEDLLSEQDQKLSARDYRQDSFSTNPGDLYNSNQQFQRQRGILERDAQGSQVATNGQLGNGQLPTSQLSNGQLPNSQLLNDQLANSQLPNGQSSNGMLPNGQLHNGRLPNGQVPFGSKEDKSKDGHPFNLSLFSFNRGRRGNLQDDSQPKNGLVTSGIRAASNLATAAVNTVGSVSDAGLEIVGGALSSAEGGVRALQSLINYG